MQDWEWGCDLAAHAAAVMVQPEAEGRGPHHLRPEVPTELHPTAWPSAEPRGAAPAAWEPAQSAPAAAAFEFPAPSPPTLSWLQQQWAGPLGDGEGEAQDPESPGVWAFGALLVMGDSEEWGL